MQKGEVMIWMQLLGFDRDDPDRGAARYLEQVGFTPDGIVALLYHPDFVHLHRGMDTEYRLFDDNAAYYGIPRNAERERQPWTNYDLRTLARALHARGVPLYASLMGAVNHSAFHTEWIEDHPEIVHTTVNGRGGMNVLKRFADGSWYEDFFAERLVQTLNDYELDGVQLCDSFCPPPGTRAFGDFSADMVRQFIDDAAPAVPPEVAASLDSDAQDALVLRQRWLWSREVRADWLRFNARRWERFFTKLAAALHAAGKKLMVLGQYCTDPFETLYCIGVDMRRLAAAGVDSFCPNLLPTSVYMQSDFPHYFFHRYMTVAPLTAACVPDAPLYSMLGVQDATEEWDVLHHAPLRFERDLYTEQSWRLETPDGSRRALRGYLLCLGDGIRSDDWTWMRERFGIAFSADVRRTLSPAVLWSDAAFDALLPSYIATRRWTPHKTVYELAAAGAPIGAAVRIDELDGFDGPLLVPCFDLLPPSEQRKAAAYPGPLICTAAPGFDPAAAGIVPDFCFSDPHASWPQTAFGRGFAVPNPKTLEKLLEQDADLPDCDPADAPEYVYTLIDTLAFRKVSPGFLAALVEVLRAASGGLFTANCPFTAFELKNGAYRLYLYNANPDQYVTVKLSCARPAASAKIVSRYPHLPVQFEAPDGRWVYDGGPSKNLRTKVAPSGVTIVDITLA